MKYAYRLNDNDTFGFAKYDTIEDALESAKKEIPKPTSVEIGECVPHEPYIDATEVRDRIQEMAYEECDDAAEGYLDYLPDGAIDDLDKQLAVVLDNWLNKYKLRPTFGTIENIKKYSI